MKHDEYILENYWKDILPIRVGLYSIGTTCSINSII